MFKKISIFLVVFTLSAFLSNAYADSVVITSISEVEISIKKSDGTVEVKRVPASNANVGPGDIVIFSNICENKGDKPAENIAITNPVPKNTFYVDGSAQGDGTTIEFSVDGGKYYGKPSELKVKDKHGKMRRASAQDYTHIRWLVLNPLKSGEKLTVSFKAKIR